MCEKAPDPPFSLNFELNIYITKDGVLTLELSKIN
jgi:hypothetical protein